MALAEGEKMGNAEEDLGKELNSEDDPKLLALIFQNWTAGIAKWQKREEG